MSGTPTSRTSRRPLGGGRRSLAGMLAVAGVATLAGFSTSCDSAGEQCQSDEEYFAKEVWAPVLFPKCADCHSPTGVAAKTKFVLKTPAEAGFIEANYQAVKEVASFQKDGTSLLLLKPARTIDHYGGEVLPKGSAEYQKLEALVERFSKPSGCDNNHDAYFSGVTLKSPKETLRKASLLLVGRLPTEQELSFVDDGNIDSIGPILLHYMEDEAFLDRIKEIYNDRLLTDRYLGNTEAIDLLESDYYDPYWFENLEDPDAAAQKYGALSGDDLVNKLASRTNLGVAREPLELIAHVVRNDLPFTEVLTADYMMVNPYSAKAFGMTEVEFENDVDATEFKPGYIYEYPHAGILTSPMFLNRWPTTPTNRNRARARRVYEFFLGTDILKTAEQPIDPTKATGFNPTLYNPACTGCHSNIDPIAGCFHSFDDRGRYAGEDDWFNDMRPPGFGNEVVPYDQFPTSLQWLAPRLAADHRFALGVVFNIYRGLTRQAPLVAPSDTTAPDFDEKFEEYLAQYDEFNAIAQAFEASDYDLRQVVIGIVRSQYFRAKNYDGPEGGEARVKELGSAQFLTPEVLHRKIQAVLGVPWRPRAYEGNGSPYDYLLRTGEYRLLYGGIDSADVTSRMEAPNGIMANIAERMANEMSCKLVPLEFQKSCDPSAPESCDRTIFTEVTMDFEPEDASGFKIEGAQAAIRKQIQKLHFRILGEDLAEQDPEIEREFQLFLETWREGKKAIEAGTEGYDSYLPYSCQVNEDYWTQTELPEEERLQQDPNYTVRAWMSVVSYMLADYAFLYE
jgi:hypothetical protein